jgi:hypothetical protein
MTDSLSYFLKRLLANLADSPLSQVEKIWQQLPNSYNGATILRLLQEDGILSRVAAKAVLLAHEGRCDERDIRQLLPKHGAQLLLDRLADFAEEGRETILNQTPIPEESFAEERQATPRLRLGQYLGRYLIKGWLGRGAGSQVYLSVHPTLGIPIALKVFQPNPSMVGEFFAQQFRTEARTLARLDHPNILRVFDMEEGDRPFLALEFAAGPNLHQMLQTRGVLELKEAFSYAMQVARALKAAHKTGLAHLDVKPGNVLTTIDGIAKLADFGIANLRRHLSVRVVRSADAGTRVVQGTAPYMGPEQEIGQAGTASDIHALGVLMLEMLTGRLPVTARMSPLDCETLPPKIAKLLLDMTDPDPILRPMPLADLLPRIESAFDLKLELD